jgi:hypothetical protein
MHSRPSGVIEGVGGFGSDVATLAVLQARLARCDLREGLRQTARLWATLAIVAVFCLAGVIALVLGAAFWIATAFELGTGKSMVLVGAVCVVVSSVIAIVCIRVLTTGPSIFQRSIEEFERNLAWVKTTLTQSGR